MSFLLSSPGTTNLPDVFEKYPERSVLILHLIDDIMRKEFRCQMASENLSLPIFPD